MSLLPEEFARAEKRPSGLFPAHDVAPLIDFEGQIAVRLYPFGVHGTDNRLGSRSYSERLRELFSPGDGNDGDFGRKALHVLGFLCKEAHGDEEREISVFHTLRLKAFIHFFLNVFPNGIAVRPYDHRAFDGAVIDELCL